jgi:flavin-dependent dehydrogenase
LSARDFDLIVVGGGPAGSTAATIAARAGLAVLLVEAGSHPRAHVGESLLPGIIPILDELGVLGEVEAEGFTRKTGSTHWGWGLTPEWDLWFTDSEAYDHAWLVERSRFDEILFRAARRAGAETHEQAPARSFLRDGDRVTGISFWDRETSEPRTAKAPLTIDATGQAAMLARELDLRSVIPGLQHEASWAHFVGSGRLAPPRSGQALFVANETRWMWHFPLAENLFSVGIVRLEDDPTVSDKMKEEAFDAAVRTEPRMAPHLGESARRITPVRNVRDWSYRLSRVCGPGFMLAGDASGFIDPVLSTGVLLAMHAGYDAARHAIGIHRGDQTESRALEEYEAKHRALFRDLLRIVRFFYQQNLHKEDYFWKAKSILLAEGTELKPQKAFMVLTSGLVQNLAYDAKREAVLAAREARALGDGTDPAISNGPPEKLGFVCVHVRYSHEEEKAALYFLIEPIDPAAPTLFRTKNFHLNCLAPRFDNDPISVPSLAPHLRAIRRRIDALDTEAGESLARFWRRAGGAIVAIVEALPKSFELVRVFGE